MAHAHAHAAAIVETPEQGLPVSNAKLAMWLFLATEIMFFMGLIGTYIALRFSRADWPTPEIAGLNVNVGAFNTLVLIASSVTVVLALSATERGDRRQQALYLAITAALGTTFMVVKAFEYQKKYEHGTLQLAGAWPVLAPKSQVHLFEFQAGDTSWKDGEVPDAVRQAFSHHRLPLSDTATMSTTGPSHSEIKDGINEYALEAEAKKPAEKTGGIVSVHGPLPGGGLWPSLYFTLTGFHGLHVVGGVVMLVMLLSQSLAGVLGPDKYERVELIGLYWHFVDIVWIFLFPLLYMIA